jgi:hypothetical protein
MSEIGFEYQGKDEFEYGIIAEFQNTILWYEPITDEVNGFVLRQKEDSGILAIYREENTESWMKHENPDDVIES